MNLLVKQKSSLFQRRVAAQVKSFSLPYNFDTRVYGRLAGSGFLLMAAMSLVLLFLLNTFAWSATLIFHAFWCVIGAIWMYRRAGGAFGTIGRQHVTVEPDRFLGIKTSAHQGTFATSGFRAVEVKCTLGDKESYVLDLKGIDPTMSLTVAKAPRVEVKPLAAFLAKELNLTLIDPTP